jgi:Glyoxalase superfamily protein
MMTEQMKADRFVCANDGRPKKKGKHLKMALAAAGYDISLARCYESIARMYGFRNWDELRASMGDGVIPSPNDEKVEEELFSRRFWHQVEKLKEIGVSQADAEDIIDQVRPTSATSQAVPADTVID